MSESKPHFQGTNELIDPTLFYVGGDSDTHPCKPQLSDCELEVSSTKQDEELSPEEPAEEPWSPEEKDRLFQFVTRLFLMNFPLYVAYKHAMPSSLEELSQQEVAALNNYCELAVSSVLVPVDRDTAVSPVC